MRINYSIFNIIFIDIELQVLWNVVGDFSKNYYIYYDFVAASNVQYLEAIVLEEAPKQRFRNAN